MWLLTIILSYHVIRLGGASLTEHEIMLFRQNGITVTDNTDSWIFSHSGLPNHSYSGGWGNNPNTPTAQNYSYEIPKNPTPVADDEEGCVYLGAIAMAISGATFFNPYTGVGYNAVAGDCKETFDDCDGHPNDRGTYHYHQLPSCLYDKEDLRDVLLGVAFDGYPIYGPMDSTGQSLTSAELDKCHGHIYKGRYVYRITMDFPYIMGCYRGELLINQRPMPGGGDGRPPRDGGDGMRPPPRQRRGVQEVKMIRGRMMYRRQVMVSDCRSAEETNWQQMTCWAVCENPSTGECETEPTTPTVQITTTEDVSSGRQLGVSGFVLLCAALIVLVL